MAVDTHLDYSPDSIEPAKPNAAPKPLLGPKTKLGLFAGLIVIALAFFATMAIRNASVYYLTVGELQQQGATAPGKSVRVEGALVPNTFHQMPSGLDVAFTIKDAQGNTLPAVYNGQVGELFFNTNSKLILEGAYKSNGTFDTQNVIVKCPTKYINQQDAADQYGPKQLSTSGSSGTGPY